MASASVVLRGRFKPGTQVRLVRVAHEGVLRSEGGQEVGTAKVDEDGVVRFNTKDAPGSRYFIVGYVDGVFTEVRIRGRAPGDEAEFLGQAPVLNDRVKLSDGSFLDEPPVQHQKFVGVEPAPHLGQHQVPEGVIQRSDTPRGSAHPVDVNEPAPYRRQEDVPSGTVQMSDTKTGAAAEIVSSVQRQEDAVGILQRSDTPYGRAFPIPKGDAVQNQLDKESSAGKETRGEPGRVASEPFGVSKVSKAGEQTQAPVGPGAPSEGENVSGLDAMGQPVYADIAAGLGVKAPKKGSKKPVGEAPDAKRAEVVDADPPQEAGASETEDASTGAGQAKPSGEHSASKGKSTKAKEK